MNVDNLNKRYFDLKGDVQEQLEEAVKKHGGTILFVSEDDPRLEEVDDLSELNLVLVDAYSHSRAETSWYYVTSLVMDKNILYVYGVDENKCMDLEDETEIDYLSISGMISILERIPD